MATVYGSVNEDGTVPSSNNGKGDATETSTTTKATSGRATILSCTINLANTIVGAGMLGLPGAFGGTGWLAGLILIVISAAFSAHGLVLLSKAAQRAGLPSSFYSVALAAVPRYTILIDLAVAMKCFGVATGYLITVADCMIDALDHVLLNGNPENDESFVVSLLLSRHFWVVGALLAVLPFSFYRTLDELKKASALALVFVFLLAAGIIAYASGAADPCYGFDDEADCRGDVVPVTNLPSMASKLPIFVFAFTCHQNVFPIVNEIQFRTQRRINTVIVSSIGFALTLFAVVALEGYRTYGSYVNGDILTNYPETGKVTFLRICIAFMLTLHYPLQLDPSRRCITSLVKVVKEWWQERDHTQSHRDAINRAQSKGIEMKQGNEETGFGYNELSPVKTKSICTGAEKDDNTLFYAVTVSFLLLSFTIAMVVDDLGVILALVGATGSTLVSYVLPGLIFIKIYPYRDASMMCAYVQLIVGLIIMPLALYFVITGKVRH